MDRNGITITFSTKERSAFSVPEALTVSEAVVTAVGLQEAACSLLGRNVQENSLADTENRMRVGWRAIRAGELGGFARQIFDLCPDEHLAYLASAPPKAS